MDLPKGLDERAGGIRVRFQHRGTPFSRLLPVPITPAGVAHAARFLEAWKAHVIHGAPPPEGLDDAAPLTPGQTPAFIEVAQDYLDKADIRLSSRNTYRDLLNIYWLPHLERDAIGTIRGKRLREIDRATDWPSPGLRKNAITALRQVFEHAIDEELIDENPARGLRVRRIQKDSEPDPYTLEERGAILDWLAARHGPTEVPRLVVEMAFGTGMRTGELLGAQAGDWRRGRAGALYVVRSRVRGQIVDTKTSELRSVLVDDELAAMLEARTAEMPDDGWILTTRAGEPYRYPGKAFRGYRAALDALGIRKRTGPYPWRHTYASIGLSTPGVTAEWLANQLGHSLSMFERVYARWIHTASDAEQLQRMAESMRRGRARPGPSRRCA